jgi:transcriptional regulator with XRE-family HTH domain
MTKIGKLKEVHRLTLGDLKKKTGLSRSFISQACSGARNIGSNSAVRFLKAFQTKDLFLTLDDIV